MKTSDIGAPFLVGREPCFEITLAPADDAFADGDTRRHAALTVQIADMPRAAAQKFGYLIDAK
ncbi:hypothetical protein SKA53_00235 [Yoonia vestfoldensis SKA53]|uniref:Uncharacterized protein n=1 Tax=Yoonia vestfoldensis SKA53 TaxID=314232 RepID=A3V8Z4_9RHOB|nr:hypothetical protein SKA53_00235 [Yoonia vestfoldensis SKA53]